MRSTRKTLIIGILFLLICLSSSVHAQEPLTDTILKIVAGEQSIEQERLQIATIETESFPLIGVTLYQAKVVDTATGEVYSVVVDEAGLKQDVGIAHNAEIASYQAQYGSLDPALYERLQTVADDERLMVAIWLRADNAVFPERPDFGHKPAAVETGEEALPPPAEQPKVPPESLQEKTEQQVAALGAEIAAIRAQQAEQRQAIETARQSAGSQLTEQMTVLQQPLLAALVAEGFAPTHVSSTSPLIYVELSKSAILELAQRADVASIYSPNENFPEMSSAKPTQKADVVDSWGFDGSGIDVAILERDRIQFDNPWLDAGTTRDATGPVGEHVTAVAGIVASQHTTHQGIAQGVSLFSANATTWDDANLSAAMQWAAVTQTVDVINNSWGGNAGDTNLNEHDRHLDYIVRYEWSTVIKSAGNEANGCGNGTGRVTSPGRGYNVITVGNYDDHDTLTWDDDTIDSCSSFVNPSTGIEKPEVAAVGSSINSTTDSDPWIGDVGSGTSFAAPMVTGEAALLMDRDSSLEVFPEAVKAIIMATALHNIEGGSRLSDQDGAGGVDMQAAFRAVDEGWWAWRAVNSSSFPYSYTVYAYAGEVVRAAIAWDSNPAADYSTDPLQADIDLAIYSPSGGYVTGSASFNNSYEIVEFTASQTGNYELRIEDWRFDGTIEYVGAAWWPGHRVLTAYTPQTLNIPPIARDYLRFAASSFWNAVGIRSPSGSDYDIYLYAGSAFGNPDDHDWLEDSTLGDSAVDFVLVDRNHAPTGSYYPEVRRYSGSGGNYPIEWATHTGDIAASGSYGPFTMSDNSVVRVWDILFQTGQTRKVIVRPTAGTADLGVALFDSDPGTSASFYQGRSQAVATADANGAGLGETLVYTNSGPADWMGLVVYNNSSTSANFYLDVDVEVSPPVDVYLIVDLTSSFADDLPVFKAQAPGIISTLQASIPDIRFGLGKFEDYPIWPFGSASDGDKAYERLVDLTSDTNLVLNTINGLFTRWGVDSPESQLPALYQAATGAGQDLSGVGYPGASIPSGQQANFRTEAVKIILLWTDAPFHRPGDPGDIPYPGPSFGETVSAIRALEGAKVVGIFASGLTSASANQGVQELSLGTGEVSAFDGLSDLESIAAATGGLAPADGVDCDGNGTIDLAPGQPLVCSTGSSGEGIGEAIIALVEAGTKPSVFTIHLPIILKNY